MTKAKGIDCKKTLRGGQDGLQQQGLQSNGGQQGLTVFRLYNEKQNRKALQLVNLRNVHSYAFV